MKRKKQRNWFLVLLFLISLSSFVYFSIPFVNDFLVTYQTNKNAESAQALVEKKPESKQDNKKETKQPTKKLTQKEPDFTEIKKINDEIIGWIYVPGTNIDEPITQTTNNEYYLAHDWNHEYNKNGAIFMDYVNKNDYDDLLTFIFGHQTFSDNKFTQLAKFSDPEFTKKHNKFYIYTLDHEELEYEVLSAEIIPPVSNIYLDTKFGRNEDDLYSMKTELANYASVTQKELDSIHLDSNLVALVTCVDTSNIWERRIVIAKLTNVREYKLD